MSRKKAEGEARNSPISIKATADLKARLEKAAEVNGRSLAQEVEARLEQSLRDAPLPPLSDVTRNFTRVVALSLNHIEQMAGRSWFETKALCAAARETVAEVFKDIEPIGSDHAPMTADEQEEARRLAAAGKASANFLTFRIDLNEFRAAAGYTPTTNRLLAAAEGREPDERK